MLVSTFELLVRPIAPPGVGPAALARTVVQGYFLSIANTSNTAAPLQLTFTATTPNLSVANTVVIQDITGTNTIGSLVPVTPNRLNYNITIPANDTALVILQPDVRQNAVLTGGLEVRGYVEINALSNPGFTSITYELLLTPEHRGTFFSGSASAPAADIDQLVYSLPTALGRAQYSLTSQGSPFNPKVIKDLTDVNPKPIEIPLPKVTDTAPVLPLNVQAMLDMMAQRIAGLEAAISQGQAFIQPSERPAVGTPASNGN